MKRLRYKLIKQLNAIPEERIPPHIKQQLINHWMNEAMDKKIYDIIESGFISPDDLK